MLFANFFGHEFIKSRLTKLLASNTFPQVALFSGQRGVGKRAFALECAKALLGASHAEKIAQNSHPDVHLLLPEGKASQHPIETIKALLEKADEPAFEASRAVFIIEDAERMLPSSANALLKLLEEPPSHVFFILITHASDKMLPTILSRTQKFSFSALPSAKIAEYIQEHFGLQKAQAERVSIMAQGSLKRAIELAQHKEDISISALVAQILSLSIVDDYLDISIHLGKLQELLKSPEEEDGNALIERVFEEVLYWFRDKEAIEANVTWSLIYHREHEDLLRKSSLIPYVKFEEAFDLITQAQEAVLHNVKFSTVFENFLLHAQKAAQTS